MSSAAPTSQPKVTIVVLNYNSFEKVLACVASLEKLNYSNFSILVVDNASPGEIGPRLVKALPQHRVILNSLNSGYAGGNNVGIRAALAEGADLVWILNYDAQVEPSCLSEMVKVQQSIPQVGLVGSLTLYDHSQKIYFYKGQISAQGRVYHPGENQLVQDISELQNKPFGQTDFVNGTSILFSREVIERAGYIPEEFFLYYEDPAWSLQVARKGFKNVVAHKAIVYHIKADNPGLNYTAEFYNRRNEYFFRREYGYPMSRVHFLARLKVRRFKHLVKAWLYADWQKHRNMVYVLDKVSAAVRDSRRGYEPLKVPYPEAK